MSAYQAEPDEESAPSLGSILAQGGAVSQGAAPTQEAQATDDSEPTLESVRANVAALHQRMEELRAATEVEVLKAWQSPWKSEATVKAKVDSRLASNAEFRVVMTKAREAVRLEASLDPDHQDASSFGTGSSHPAIGR